MNPNNMFSLKDKVALVTGASQGIGRDTALALSKAGAKVAVAARSEEKLLVLVREITSAGGEALAIKIDVADQDQVKSAFKQVLDKFAHLDILVNNAGTIMRKPAADHPDDYWDKVIEVNLNSQFILSRELG